jgi:hypothetical protein
MDLIFVHVPKTGGTFLHLIDLVPNPMIWPHEPISKLITYKENKNKKTFTMVRDPYDISCSEYYFFKKEFGFKTKNPSHEYHAKLIHKEKMSVEEYLENKIKNSIYPYYYDVLTPKNFDCVGITEEMDTTIQLLEKMFGIRCGIGKPNNNKFKKIKDSYETKFSRKKFYEQNDIDYNFFLEGKDRFFKLCHQFDVYI